MENLNVSAPKTVAQNKPIITTTPIPPTPKKVVNTEPVIQIDKTIPIIPVIKTSPNGTTPPPAIIVDKQNPQRSNFITLVVKNTAKALLILTILAHFGLKADLSEENEYFSKIGVANTGKTFSEQSLKIEALERDNAKISQEIRSIQNKIDKKQFSEYSLEIENIQKLHLNWFDSRKDGVLHIGLFDAAEKVAEYFQSNSFKDENNVIDNGGNSVVITSQSITRDTANVSISITQSFKRIFFLANEFTNQMNALPFFKDGSLSEFSRTKKDDGPDTMEFGINLNRQEETDTDTADERFSSFNTWVNSK